MYIETISMVYLIYQSNESERGEVKWNMDEMQRDALSNGCVEAASSRLNEGKRFLKNEKYNEAVCSGFDVMLLGMESVLALDDVVFRNSLEEAFPAEAAEKIINTFTQMYLDSEILPPEWKETSLALQKAKDEIIAEDGYAIPKEQAGKLIAQVQGFLQEMVDFLVMRNAKYAGQ